MTKNKLHITLLYLMLLITITTIGVLVFHKSTATRKPKKMNMDNRVFFWEIYPELVIPNSGMKIDGKLNIRDLNNNDISIQKLSSNLPLLIFRYSHHDCNLCIDQVLDKLQATFKGNENNVCLIVDGMTARDFRIKYKNRNITFPIYLIGRDNLGLSLENKNLPFLFLLDEHSKVDNLFIPFKEYPDQTDAYLKNIETLLND